MRAAAAPLLVVLTGPTGSGKSEYALQLVQRLAAWRALEIVSVDSAQVYRGMDIGTAKPERATRERVPHHLIDIRDPAQAYSAGEFVRDAHAAIAAIHARGALPLLVGGTMLYLRALRDGLASLPAASTEIRRELDALAAERGWPAMHEQLRRLDPQAAARIAPQDSQRIQRALEVQRLTGVPISRWHDRTEASRDAYRWLRFALWPGSRAQMRDGLERRFAAMLRAGLVDEVRQLYERGDLTPQHPSMRAVGYRQLWQYCANQLSLQQASSAAVNATAQLAKRQLTWLRRDPELRVLPEASVGVSEEVTAAIVEAARA
ncbi:MAG: tRNA (adenosine(37)-N6)-dimethylallyltransferase MiaA [Steroidobacteraceae bacterium]|jgi:tRNA dimethylallyltransferase